MAKTKSNGSLKGSNGHVNGHANGKPLYRSKPLKKRPGILGWVFAAVARLSIYATIFSLLFRCPPTLDACDETSPFVCKYYFQTKNAILPHVQPYYDQHAAPYVQIAKPYYDAVDARVLSPTRQYAVHYAAPWVEKGQVYARDQWDKNAQPHLTKAQAAIQDKYDVTVAPYLKQANGAVGPYYEIARTNALQLYYEFLVPGYQFVQPYAVQGYNSASDFTVTKALPAAHWGWDKTSLFFESAVWPHLRVVYLENVEPQLHRIGERLGRYRSKNKAKSPPAEPLESLTRVATGSSPSSFSKPTPQTSTVASATEEPVASQAAEPEASADFVVPVQAPPAADGESETRRKAREMVAEDLEMWQTKFAAQADEGANDMEDRVTEIAQRVIAENAEKTGKGLVSQLRQTIETETNGLKAKIAATVDKTGEGDSTAAEAEILQAIRTAGVAIKEKAQAIRAWREDYEADLQDQVLRAADVHFEILDETRNLALQKIGMKWAWTDGVTYKDWAKYHELKATLAQWTEQLKQLIVTHPGLEAANEAAAEVEDEGMNTASAAARELGRLKEVAHWKLVAKDATDNFESEAMEAAAAKAQEAKRLAAEEAAALKDKVAQQAKDASSAAAENVADASSSASSFVSDKVEVVEEAVSSGTEAAAEFAKSNVEAAGSAASSASEFVADLVDSSTQAATEAASSVASSVASDAKEAGSTILNVASEASEAAAEQSTAASQAASSYLSEGDQATSQVGEGLKDNADAATAAVVDSAESVGAKASSLAAAGQESAASLAGEASASAESVVSEAVASETVASQEPEVVVEEPVFVEDVPVEIEEDVLAQREETPVDDTPPVKPAFLGAMAQAVPERQPILEDYVDTDAVTSATNAAQEAYSTAVARALDQYSSAVSVVSAQIYGTAKPVHEQLFSSVSSAYDNAVAAASQRLNDAVEAASSGVYGTPTPTTKASLDWAKVESIASERLNDGRLWAELQYSSAMIAMGLATPTPTSPTEKFYNQAKMQYYAGLGLAQERYSSFMAAASSAFSSVTATPTPTDLIGTASSMASVARESAASAVNAAEEAAGSAYSAATDVVASAVEAVDESIGAIGDAAREQVYLAGKALAERWDNVVAEISGRVYSEPTAIGWYDSLVSDAASATGAAADSAKTASAEAAKQYDAVSELVSELIRGKEPSFTESVLSRFNAAYATASANIGSIASQASAAAASVGDRVGSAASQATEAVKESVHKGKDEL